MESDEFEVNSEEIESQASGKKANFNGLIVAVIVAVGVAAFFAGSYFTQLNSQQITQDDLDAAISKLELKILQNQLTANQPALPVAISADDDPVMGNDNAPITIIEFSDFQCPYCARFHAQTLPLLLENYIDSGKVKLVYRDFPLQNIHPNALPASVAAECADEQGKYWQYHDALFENQNQWNNLDTIDAIAKFGEYASVLELNQEQFNTCLNTGKYVSEIKNDLDDGREYGIDGTPGFFVGNDKLGYVKISGAEPFENFKKIIDSQLNS